MERSAAAFRIRRSECTARVTARMATRTTHSVTSARSNRRQRKSRSGRRSACNFIDRAAQFWVDLNTIFARLTFLQKMLVTLTQLAIFIISIFFVRNGTLTPGGLVAFNGYAAMILGPFVLLGQQWQTIQNGFVALVRADKLLAQPVEKYNRRRRHLPRRNSQATLSSENVRFAYKTSNETLKGISFHATPGAKDRARRRIRRRQNDDHRPALRFLFPAERDIYLIDGIDIKKHESCGNYRSHIGIVPQEPTLLMTRSRRTYRYSNTGEIVRRDGAPRATTPTRRIMRRYRRSAETMIGWRGVKLSIGAGSGASRSAARLCAARTSSFSTATCHTQCGVPSTSSRRHFEKLMQGRGTFIIATASGPSRSDLILVLKDGEIVEQGNARRRS